MTLTLLTKHVPLKDIGQGIESVEWDRYAYIKRKDATEDIAIKLGCDFIDERFRKFNHVVRDPYVFWLNPNYTIEEKLSMIDINRMLFHIYRKAPLHIIEKYFYGDIRAIYLEKRKDLTLEFWDINLPHLSVSMSMINAFSYDNLLIHLNLLRAGYQNSLFSKYISQRVFANHRNITRKDIIGLTNSYKYEVSCCLAKDPFHLESFDILGKRLPLNDIIEIGIHNFDTNIIAENPYLYNYANVHESRKLHSDLDIEAYKNTAVTCEYLRKCNINDIRMNAHLLQKDAYIAYNKNVTLRDYELCTNKFYGILRRNVVPMKIGMNRYNDIDIIMKI